MIAVFVLVSYLLLKENRDRITSDRDPVSTNEFNTIDEVTAKCFFDVKLDDFHLGRLTIGLFGNTVPITA